MTVLIVDDHEDTRMGLTFHLKGAGHRSLQASDGQEALDLLRSLKVDVVILDMMMPSTDGLQFLERMRQDPQIKDIRVIAHTANLSERTKSKAMELGVQDYITKRPGSWDELSKLLTPAAAAS